MRPAVPVVIKICPRDVSVPILPDSHNYLSIECVVNRSCHVNRVAVFSVKYNW